MTWVGRCESAHCIEASRGLYGKVILRSSLDEERYILPTDAEFAAFIIQVKNGDFDEFLEARDVS